MVQADSVKKPLVIVCGPTASGKSALAVELCLKLGSSVVSADSIALYKSLNIGTAKPSETEQRSVKHYLIDFVDAEKDYTVAEYKADASKVIDCLHNSGQIPVLCGGTGYYVDSLLFDMSYGNCPKDDKIRAEYEQLLKKYGNKYLFEMLKDVDPESYAVLHENDVVRVVRALEIYRLTGKKKSEIIDEKVPKYHYLAYAFDFDRQTLYDRINSRVDKMFESGLVEEVEWLLSLGIPANCQSMQAIGYKEIVEGLKNGDSRSTMKDAVKQNTRRYAKRQITYFKRLPRLKWLDPANYDVDIIVKEILDEFS